MIFFQLVGLITTCIIGLFLSSFLIINGYRFLKEFIAGVVVTHWLHKEWREMIRRGETEGVSNYEWWRQTFRWFYHTFWYFQTTRFTSKLGNVFDYAEGGKP